jgi:hypothetical protein
VAVNRDHYTLTLRPEANAGIQTLRLALKTLLRNYDLRCVAVKIALGDALCAECGGPFERRIAD